MFAHIASMIVSQRHMSYVNMTFRRENYYLWQEKINWKVYCLWRVGSHRLSLWWNYNLFTMVYIRNETKFVYTWTLCSLFRATYKKMWNFFLQIQALQEFLHHKKKRFGTEKALFLKGLILWLEYFRDINREVHDG